MKILFNKTAGVVAGYTDYPDEFAGMTDFAVCDIPQGWDDQSRESADWIDGVIVINPALRLARGKTNRLSELAAYRYAQETAGITLNGTMIRTGLESQAKINGAWSAAQMNPAILIDWKGGNGWGQIDAAMIAVIAGAVASHVQACFSNERFHAEAIGALETVEAVQAYDFTTGWPT